MSNDKVLYDPPSGWKYGFPKPYKPLAGETLEQTLLRDGYPQRELDSLGGARHVRFLGNLPDDFFTKSPRRKQRS
jgi:hypothetical protein